MHLPNKKGFTLIELLVVISIIAILSIIGVTIFTQAQKSARDAKRREDVAAIQKAFEQYKLTNSSYPTGCDNTLRVDAGWTLSGCGLTGYLADMPTDPINTKNSSANCELEASCYLYKICTDSSGSAFYIAANLETATGSAIPLTGAITDCKLYGGAGEKYLYWRRNQQ